MKTLDEIIEIFEDPDSQAVLALSIILFVFSFLLLVMTSESIDENTVTSIDVAISSLLTLSLVVLYFRQNKIQQQHLRVLQAEQIPKIRVEFLGLAEEIEGYPADATVLLENYGDGPAFNIEIEYEFPIENNRFTSMKETSTLERQDSDGPHTNNLSSGESAVFSFPVWMNFEIADGEDLRAAYVSGFKDGDNNIDFSSINRSGASGTLRSTDESISERSDINDINDPSEINDVSELTNFCDGVGISFNVNITYEDSYGNTKSPFGEEYSRGKYVHAGFKLDDPYYSIERLFK